MLNQFIDGGVNHLFNQLNASLKIHSKVNEGPVDTLFLVLFLLQHEHVVIEELLKTLIGVVDAKLFEGVVLKEK